MAEFLDMSVAYLLLIGLIVIGGVASGLFLSENALGAFGASIILLLAGFVAGAYSRSIKSDRFFPVAGTVILATIVSWFLPLTILQGLGTAFVGYLIGNQTRRR